MNRKILFNGLICSVVFLDVASASYDAEKTTEYWKASAKQELIQALEAQKLNRNVAKNIILFVGDGLGVSTLTAGRILKGQLTGAKGEETSLAIDKLKHVYSLDKQVPDSASTATAFLTGVKANYFTLGLNGEAEFENCSSAKGNEVVSVLVDSYKAGKSTGIISTTSLVHGTPAPAYAHSASRDWLDDVSMPDEAKLAGCKDIATQFYEASDMITVMLSGGRQHMQPRTTPDPEYPDKSGVRRDGKDLIKMWEDKMKKNGEVPKYIWNKKQFDTLNIARTDRILGLFEPEFMRFDIERRRDGAGEPSLAEMTETAIKMLRKNDNGYFLLIEGGRIDHGHHATIASLALFDAIAFDNAIAKAVEMTSDTDTLIIATADHSHPFTISGFTDRGSNIFGLVKTNSVPELALDKKTYTTITYANGAGFHGYHKTIPFLGIPIPDLSEKTERKNITEEEAASPGTYLYQTAVPLIVETHSGEDVTIHASGPMSHLFHKVHEQNYIAEVIRYAGCLGDLKSICANRITSTDDEKKAFEIDGRIATVIFASVLALTAALYLKKTRFS